MKLIKTYIIAALALVAGTLGLASCQDDFDAPASDLAPVATMEANTTILEFKKMLWKPAVNYCEPVYTKDYYAAPAGTPAEKLEQLKTEGEHIIIKGRVVSSDYAGNVFRFIVLQDEEGTCLNFSIYSYNLYLMYRRGQEVVVDLTGLHAGKFSGLFQIGAPSFNQQINGDETSFLAPGVFNSARELNGAPDPAKVDTVVLDNFNEIIPENDDLRQKWQSRLVRLRNVEFVNPSTESPGIETLSIYHETKTQQITDENGLKLGVRTSGYCNFWNTKMPEGKGDVIGILGYYQTKEDPDDTCWQLTLLDINSLQFGVQEGNPGTEDNPYTVDQAVGFIVDGSETTGWVRGYIVGTVASEVETVTSNSDIQFSATPDLGATIVIGQTPETTDIEHCLVVALKQGTDLREIGALRENPGNYKKQIDIHGTFAKVMGTYGITGNNGTSAEFHIEGVTPAPGGETIADGDGQEATPYNVAQVIAKAPTDKDNALESGVWVAGYIVGSCPDKMYSSASFTADENSSETNLLLAPLPDCKNAAQCIPVALPSTVRGALNLKANPSNLGMKLELKGDIIKYYGVPGVKNMTEYKLNGQSGGGDTPTPTPGDLVLLGSSDANGMSGWTINDVKLASGISNVWKWALYEGKYYANATAYKGVGDTESWLISPVLDMTAASGIKVKFNQACKFQTTIKDLCGLYVRESGASSWTQVAIPNWPALDNKWTWTWTNDIDLSAFAGKKVQMAFKYGGSDAGSDQWEISDLTFNSNGTITVEGGSTPTPDPTPDPTPGPTDPSDQGGTSGVFNFADPTTLTPAYSEKDQIADGSTGNFKIDVNDVTFTAASAAITNSGSGTAARLYHQKSGDWTYRFYKNTVTTIAVAAGYHITKVEFSPQTTGYITAMENATFSSGNYADKVWTPTSEVSSVTITPAATIGLTKVTVYYAK